VVNAWLLPDDPLRSAQRSISKRVTAAGLMGQLQALAIGREDDRVIPDDVAAAESVDANLRVRALARNAVTAMAEGLLELELPRLAEDFDECGRRAAGGVLLEPVVHLNDFEVELGPEDFGGLAREPKECVDAGRVVARPHHRNLRFEI